MKFDRDFELLVIWSSSASNYVYLESLENPKFEEVVIQSAYPTPP